MQRTSGCVVRMFSVSGQGVPLSSHGDQGRHFPKSRCQGSPGPQIRGMLGDAGPKEQYNYGSSPHRSGTNSPTTMVIYVIFTIIHSYNFQMMYLLVTGTAAPKWRFNQVQKVINARGLIGRVTF